MRRSTVAAMAIAAALAPAPTARADEAPRPRVLFSIDVPRIRESSSLVASAARPGLFYTANDSGDGPYVYVLDSRGRLVGTTTLAGVDPVDVEAMTGGADGSLIVGDVGDNSAVRSSVRLYQVAQPERGDDAVGTDEVTLTYADGPRNAESVLYDAADGRVFVVGKELFGGVYETPPDVFSRRAAVLRRVASAPPYATDAAFLPGDRMAVVRTYGSAYVYRVPSWRLVTSFRLPREKQGESVAVVHGGRDLLVGSEGADSPVWEVPFPRSVVRLEAAESSSARSSGPESSPLGLAAVGGAVVAVGGGGAVALRRRRRTRGSP